jgi:hypothetical protein
VDEERRDEVPWRLDPETMTIVSLDGRPLDRAFWMSRPVEERWAAAEALRRLEFGHEATTARMVKTLEILKVDWG